MTDWIKRTSSRTTPTERTLDDALDAVACSQIGGTYGSATWGEMTPDGLYGMITSEVVTESQRQLATIFMARPMGRLLGSFEITEEFIRAGSTSGEVGWNARQMAILGTDQTKGWIGRCVGNLISEEEAQRFLSLRGKKKNGKLADGYHDEVFVISFDKQETT